MRLLIRNTEELKLCRSQVITLVKTADILRGEISNRDSVITAGGQVEAGLRSVIMDKDRQQADLRKSIAISANYITGLQEKVKFWKRRTFEVAGVGIVASVTLFYFLVKK